MGTYPTRKQFEKELEKLQIELCKLRERAVREGLRGIVLFDRSWYSRASVENVMGFCSE